MDRIISFIIGIILVLISLTLAYGYGANIYKMFAKDSSKETTVIRLIGVVVPPLGIFEGFINFEDEGE